ncbi:MAG: cysteinyl-tRNA synthetase [Gammaproteobacteria bacterium]
MTIQFYNSLARRKEVFVPTDPERVTLYVCGPTVYNFAHIGNARPAVVFDVLARLLRRTYRRVVYARNITDLDDKINAAAAEQDVDISVISQKFTKIYHDDMSALGVGEPDIEPRATEHIVEMIAMIEQLITLGHAYEKDGNVLFHVPSFTDYGRLSGRDRREMIAGARVEVATYKRDDADFILWKPSTSQQPGWSSPWGFGRPGWHTECVCMIEKHLGRTIDIHGGGHDLQFPHHENEIAQARCAHNDEPLARFWLHNGFVNVDDQKMSKSIGNVLLVRDLLAQAPGEAIRLALLSAHYRKPLEWNEETLPRACRTLDRFYLALRGGPSPSKESSESLSSKDSEQPPQTVVDALQDDMNTPQAIAGLYELVQRVSACTDANERALLQRQLRAGGALLGLLAHSDEHWMTIRRGVVADVGEVDELVQARDAARNAKDFVEADRLRDLLSDRGIVLEDGPDGTQWRKGD